MPHFTPLLSEADIDQAIQASHDRPVVICKHSATCGISAEALDDLTAWFGAEARTLPAYLVTVQTHRTLSTALAERFGIRHETPQLLLLRGGRVTWHASHYHVRGAELQAALERPVAG